MVLAWGAYKSGIFMLLAHSLLEYWTFFKLEASSFFLFVAFLSWFHVNIEPQQQPDHVIDQWMN